ncbi:LamG-like jellyroll fold domain-containing protein [Lentzea flaviverrucosa]|uniref:LamG-like jellyroll fold domain-containing protein n=1 Tax=Lentzea flaviverrucosa TaxID=200379 RepID=UPI001476F463|nr:LamG-like jellyroll fold domain-containing protein [Lentzea flaviverrucosa]
MEILASRSESEQTFAKPGGGYTTEQSVEPRWARKDDGSWARVDTELRLTGTAVRPVAAVLPVEFSAGGTGPAARLRDGDRELSITWPLGPLPEPALSGSSATYAEVLPGVDLKLTASPKGFSETLVVKNREAADNENLARVTFGFAASGVTTHAAGGGLEAKDASGRVMFASPTPMMWDSSGQGVPGVSAKAVFDEPRRTAAMPVSVANGEISVVPDAAMLKHTATRYPVMIDPSWTGHVRGNEWTLVSSKEPGDAFWQGRNRQGSDYLYNSGVIGAAGTGLTCDSVSQTGTCLSPTYNVRSYFRMDLSAVKGKSITGASFRIEQKWSFTCSPNSDATVRVTNWFDGTTTWNNQPGWLWGDPWASTKPANRKHGAEHGCAGPGDVEFPLTGAVAHGASQNWDWVNVVLHVNEGTVKSWKRFNPGSAVLAIDYNSIPHTPDPVTVDGKACATGAGRPAVPTATPTIRGRVSDPDGSDTMKARFEWRRIRPNGTHGPITSLENTPWGNGTTAEQTIPKSDSTVTTGVVEGTDTLVGTGDWDNDGKPDLIYRDLDGYLYMMPTAETPAGWRSGDRVLIGTGWSGYTIAGLADWDKDGKTDIVAREDATGRLLLYPGEGKRGPSAIPPVPIGGGWGGFTFAGVADYDRDSKQDVITRDSANVLWLYPGDGNRAQPTADRVSLGAGWDNFTYYGVIDRTGDGAPDVIAEWGDVLWLYKGIGARTPQSGSYVRWQIGAGWQGATARTIADFNSDGAPDIVAKVRWSDNWYLYPGVIGTTNGGEPWTIAARGITTGDYAYRVTAGDHSLWGPASGWCEFSVDTVAPDAPTFSSSVYKTTGCAPEGCGSLGVADTFTFSSTSADVVKYRWGFTDPPVEEIVADKSARWTPPSGGPKTLFVYAVDKAGLATRSTFQFTVAGPKPHDAEWFAGDDPALDTTDNGHVLALTGLDPARGGRAVGGQTSVGFTGSTAAGATTGKVLDTSRGFSVSAWVRLGNDTANRTVVSQQGATSSAFRLGYDLVSHKWTFSLAENDAVNAVQKTAISDAPAVQGVWTHLTGTYDDSAREVRLYVDGALQRQIAVGGAFNAAGQVWIGKALRNGVAAEPWLGDLAEMRAWNRTITPQEIELMANAYEVGRWMFDEGTGSIAGDYTPFRRALKLNLAAGAKWGDGYGGRHSLELNGGGGFASTNEQVLNTDQSFTVDVWAKLSGIGTARTVVVQHGPSTVDPFLLRYDGSQWSAEMPNASVSPSTWWRAKASATAGTWTRLVVNYDANARTLKLSTGVDGTPVALKSTVTGVAGWNSTGVLSVGRSSAGEYFNGSIDELKVWQGVIAPETPVSTTLKGASISGDRNDEIISVSNDGRVHAHLNVDGAYPHNGQLVGSGWPKDRTWFADIDGDGKSEIIGVEPDGRIKAFKNVNGMNGFPYADQIFIGSAPGETKRIRFADIDGDGRDDRISIDDDGRVRVYRNLYGMNDRGQSTAFSTTPVIVKVTGAAPETVRFADIDGDGKAEFITVNPDERQSVWAYRNLGGLGFGTYDTPQEIGSGWAPQLTHFADITGDGKAEIIGVWSDGSVWSFTNYHGLTSFPYAERKLIGSGWVDPASVFFS